MIRAGVPVREAAGQGSTGAAGYHLGGKIELVRAIVRRHVTDIERIRTQMVSEAAAEVRAERECALAAGTSTPRSGWHGNCVPLAPEVFDQREDDGIVVLLDERPAEHLRDAVREAADVCHAGAIHLSGRSARSGEDHARAGPPSPIFTAVNPRMEGERR